MPTPTKPSVSARLRRAARGRVSAPVVVVVALVLLAGFSVGLLVPRDAPGAARFPAPSPSAPLATAPPAPSSGPPGSPSELPLTTTGAAVQGSPGQSVLAASGVGPKALSFTPTGSPWQVDARYTCSSPGFFVLRIEDPSGAATTLAGSPAVGLVQRTLRQAGTSRLLIGPDCSWVLRARG